MREVVVWADNECVEAVPGVELQIQRMLCRSRRLFGWIAFRRVGIHLETWRDCEANLQWLLGCLIDRFAHEREEIVLEPNLRKLVCNAQNQNVVLQLQRLDRREPTGEKVGIEHPLQRFT